MIVGIGLDLVENRRVAEELARGDWQAQDGIFTPDEISRGRSLARPALHYAACFAVKEAVLKALGLTVCDLALFQEVEVNFGNGNEPRVVLSGRLRKQYDDLGAKHIRLSVTNSRQLTGAVVILEA